MIGHQFITIRPFFFYCQFKWKFSLSIPVDWKNKYAIIYEAMYRWKVMTKFKRPIWYTKHMYLYSLCIRLFKWRCLYWRIIRIISKSLALRLPLSHLTQNAMASISNSHSIESPANLMCINIMFERVSGWSTSGQPSKSADNSHKLFS